MYGQHHVLATLSLGIISPRIGGWVNTSASQNTVVNGNIFAPTGNQTPNM